jgi:hypothetical protein
VIHKILNISVAMMEIGAPVVAEMPATCKCLNTEKIKGKIEGKLQPRTGNEGLERQWRCSSSLSLTSALEGGGWSRLRSGRFTTAYDPVLFVQKAL